MTTTIQQQQPATLDTIEVDVMRVAPDAALDIIAMADQRLAFIEQWAKQQRTELDRRIVEYIQANGTFRIGTVVFTLKPKSSTKCIDTAKCLEAILELSGGDWVATCAMLGSQPIKYGAAKAVLGERWGEFFKVETKPKLEREDAGPELSKIDTKYIK